MDAIGLATLISELRQDCAVAAGACALAGERADKATAESWEGCAHHLCRFYNVVEQMALRVAKAFENHLDDETGWHVELMRRLTLCIPGVRPALIPVHLAPPLRELRAFRHVLTHAYDLTLDPDKLRLLLKYARQVAPELSPVVCAFARAVSSMHAIPWEDAAVASRRGCLVAGPARTHDLEGSGRPLYRKKQES